MMRASAPRRTRLATLVLVGFTALVAGRGAHAQEPRDDLPAPEDVLGFRPGEPRRLAGWETISTYLDTLGAASDRVRVDTIGRSTLDRPMQLLTISSAGNLARLGELRNVQARLADPRGISNAAERAALLREGRLVVLVTAGLHSTEVGGSLLPVRLAHHLATSGSAEVERILEQTIVLLVPSMNPDGVDAVAEWYESTLDMPWEGAEPPFLYHHYAGHDNNRDWYAFALAETRAIVNRVHNAWHPHVVLDLHQQRMDGARQFVPPWLDPVEPHVDPALIAGASALGSAIAWSMTRAGLPGVLVAGDFDAWSPARAYSHYHGGVRILGETAGARMGSSVELTPDQLRPGRGYDPRRPSWNQPWPWPGGRWGLPEILDYMHAASMALLRIASDDRESWLESFVAIGDRAVAGSDREPRAWALPPAESDPDAAEALVAALLTAGVEVSAARDSFRSGGRSFPAGTYVVDARQPYAAFASAVLDPVPYPATFDERGRPVAPYDGTAHTLALLYGIDALHLDAVPDVDLAPVAEARRGRLLAPGVTDNPGALVGVYRSYIPEPSEGWIRWWFDRAAVPYASLENAEIRAGDLSRRFTAIILPSATEQALLEGWDDEDQSPLFSGGLGEPGVQALREFVETGGTLVTLNRASGFAIRQLDLPVEDPVSGLTDSELLAAGAIVALDVDSAHAMASGLPERVAAWVDGGSDFRPLPDSDARIVARYAVDPVVLSGWIHGASRLAGAGAIVEVPLGLGRVVLFGFHPEFRGQARATMPLLFNALRRPADRAAQVGEDFSGSE